MLTKEELKAKLAADPEFKLNDDASEDEKNLFNEAKAEVEAEEKEKAEIEAAEKEKKKKEEEEMMKKKKMMSEYISVTDHAKEMNELKSRLGIAEKKLQFKEVSEQVEGYIFSDSNPDGVLLPKNKQAAIDIITAASPKVAELFKKFVEGLPKVSAKLFREEGGDGVSADDNQSKIDAEVEKIQKENPSMKYSEALKVVNQRKPELFVEKK